MVSRQAKMVIGERDVVMVNNNAYGSLKEPPN